MAQRLTPPELFARRGDIPDKINDPWTVFEVDLRDPAPIPDVLDFTRFLASSIPFTTHLCEVSLYFDDKRLAHLTKTAAIPKQLTMPQGLRPTSPMGFMNVKGLKSTCKWFIDDRVCFVLTIYSPTHYRGSHELGLWHWDEEA